MGNYSHHKGYTFAYLDTNGNVPESTAKFTAREHSKPVYCLETDKIHASSKEAADELKLDRKYVAKVAKGLLSHTKGYTFSYIKAPNA